MYQYVLGNVRRLNVPEMLNQIAGQAFLYLDKGNLELWIYLKDGELKFYPCRFPMLANYLVGHYKCDKITQGFSNADWNKLSIRIYRAHLESC